MSNEVPSIAFIVDSGLETAQLRGDARARRVADHVIERLQARDDEIADRVITAAEGAGFETEARNLLVEMGVLSTPEPTNGDVQTDPGGTVVGVTLDAWAKMQATLDDALTRVGRLERIAQTAGMMGRPVGD